LLERPHHTWFFFYKCSYGSFLYWKSHIWIWNTTNSSVYRYKRLNISVGFELLEQEILVRFSVWCVDYSVCMEWLYQWCGLVPLDTIKRGYCAVVKITDLRYKAIDILGILWYWLCILWLYYFWNTYWILRYYWNDLVAVYIIEVLWCHFMLLKWFGSSLGYLLVW
jgi:hypothetical protein